MIMILLAAAAVSFITSILQGDADITEPIIILAIVVLNALLGVIQENRAEKSLEALKKLSSPHASVIRDGKEILLNAEDVVAGDLIRLAAGDLVPADCRLTEANNLTVDESSLTGESMLVEKDAGAVLNRLTPLADRKNIVMSGTSVTGGKALAIAVKTGMDTEVGHIAAMLIDNETPQTPLQKKLSDTGKILGITALLICCVIFVIGILHRLPPFDMFMTSVSLAVAAIPEGLPSIVTIMLAIGLMRMSKHNAIVRNLPSVETLGGASVICSDKTGTLTENKMSVTAMYSKDENHTLRLAALCSDADRKNPPECAILDFAAKNNIDKSAIDKKNPRCAEIPFDSKRKRMTTVNRTPGGFCTIVKGAPEFILPLCAQINNGVKSIPLTQAAKKKILSENSKMADASLRVIAVAYRDDTSRQKIVSEKNMVFSGLIGLEDPPRFEAVNAVRLCKKAGIRPVMITGDHAGTAFSIARQTGITDDINSVITGGELDKMSDETLAKRVKSYSVFARVTPEHKVRIVKAFQANGEITAMTGDGVNDAPALKAADIGCSMGISGTDVAKSASDMVLTDDNFATIVYAVREGRGIFANIKKAVQFLLSSNIGEILTVFSGLLLSGAPPLSAIQLLWVNLVTDSLPAIALGLDPCEDDIMEKPPRDPKKSLFADGLWSAIIMEGLMIGALALLAFSIGINVFGSGVKGSTMAFAVLSISQLVHAFNMRSDGSVIKAGLFKNPYLVLSLIVGLIFEVGVIMISPLSEVFGVIPLNAIEWLTVGIISVMPLVILELQKAFSRALKK
ncbi:MAG: cation-translocating P-type ATPase [Oscillospiraceae bacterium]|nr:cation-translocating P-type ATPase [Oscillospiraceae bacterium]